MGNRIKLYSLQASESKTYGIALLFVIGSVVLPQLVHLIPRGGMIWLPIYFFTLVSAYKYGMTVGLITAVLSPLINCSVFGMPGMAALPSIMTKSMLLAFAAGYCAQRFSNISIPLLAGVVLFYQVIGSLTEWAFTGSVSSALQDFRLGLPGMVAQIVGCYILIKYCIRK